jgi:hypothetical protein
MDGLDGRPRRATVTSGNSADNFENMFLDPRSVIPPKSTVTRAKSAENFEDMFLDPRSVIPPNPQFEVDWADWQTHFPDPRSFTVTPEIATMMTIKEQMDEPQIKQFKRFVMSLSDSRFEEINRHLVDIPKLEESLKSCLKDAWKRVNQSSNILVLPPYYGLCTIYEIVRRIIFSHYTTPDHPFVGDRHMEDLFNHICRILCNFIPYNPRDTPWEGILNISMIRYYIKFGNLTQLDNDFFSFKLPDKYNFEYFMKRIVATAEEQNGAMRSAQGGKSRRRRQHRRRHSIKKSKSRSRSRSRFRKVRKTRHYRK